MSRMQPAAKRSKTLPDLFKGEPAWAASDPMPVRNVADLLAVIDAWTGLPEQTRRVLKANTRTAIHVAVQSKARMDGRSIEPVRNDAVLATVPVDVPWLNEHLYAFPPGLFGITKRCRNLSITGLRRVLRHVGLIEPIMASRSLPPGSPWRELLDRLSDDVYAQAALATFGKWCHSAAIQPGDVSPATLDAFESFVRTRMLHSNIPRLLGMIGKTWEKAAKLLQDWPKSLFKAKPKKGTYTYPFSAFPTSFQADVGAFARRLTGENRNSPFRGDGPRRALRPSTIKTCLYNLRQAASALVLQGRDISTILGLADLVDETAFEVILRFYWERAMASRTRPEELKAGHKPDPALGVTSQTGSIAATLMGVAKHHCKLDAETITRLRPLAQDVTPPPQKQLTAKNRERLRQFDDPKTRAALLHLPQRLKQYIEEREREKRIHPLEAARLARVAAAIELLLHVPLRNANLTGLRLGIHLRYDGGRTGHIRHMVLQSHETKNHYDGEWPIGPELAVMLDWYVRHFRPRLNPTDGDWLFPAGFGKAGPLSNVAMAHQIVQIVADKVGAVVNPHLFRCICARFIFEHSPEALEDVRLMIGDKLLAIVLAHYGASQPAHASRRTDNRLRRLRSDSAHLVAALAKPRRKATR